MCVYANVCVCVRLIPYIRVASVQSEPGQQNLLIQPPLGRKRGLRQVRRPSILVLDIQLDFFSRLFETTVDILVKDKFNEKGNCKYQTLMLLQLRRPLLSIPKNEPRGRSGARLSTTRRSIQPKNKPMGNSTFVFVCACVCVYNIEFVCAERSENTSAYQIKWCQDECVKTLS